MIDRPQNIVANFGRGFWPCLTVHELIKIGPRYKASVCEQIRS